jgi:hypothetical protein
MCKYDVISINWVQISFFGAIKVKVMIPQTIDIEFAARRFQNWSS